MKKLFASLAALAGCLGMTACAVDRGNCLASHPAHSDGYFYTTPMSYDGGKTFVQQLQYMPDSDWEQCDRWEFPEGRPGGSK